MKIYVAAFISVLIITVLFFLIKVARVLKSSQEWKWSPFECGLRSATPQHIPFSIQFFLVAILFLVFDVEISLLVPYPIEIKSTVRTLIILLFILILVLGLLYE